MFALLNGVEKEEGGIYRGEDRSVFLHYDLAMRRKEKSKVAIESEGKRK